MTLGINRKQNFTQTTAYYSDTRVKESRLIQKIVSRKKGTSIAAGVTFFNITAPQ